MCNLYSPTKGQAAIGEWFRGRHDRSDSSPLFPGIFPVRANSSQRADGERELVMACWACLDHRSSAASGSQTQGTSAAHTGADGWAATPLCLSRDLVLRIRRRQAAHMVRVERGLAAVRLNATSRAAIRNSRHRSISVRADWVFPYSLATTASLLICPFW